MNHMVDGNAIMNNHDHPFGGSTTVGSATVTSPSSSITQQTFTTAGTPYRPGVPSFQRPERRNRYRTDDSAHNGLSLLPKHDMHRVLANGGLVGGSVPQYTPLQQNNDRAANPAKSFNLVSPSMGSGSPTTGSARSEVPLLEFGFGASTSSSQHGVGTYNDEPIAHKRVDGHESDNDAALTKNPFLSSMTVKSIQNLASYTNPNQDNARKLLAHRARMGLNGLAQSNGGPTGSSESRSSFKFGEESVSPTTKYSTRANALNDSPVPFGVDQYAKRMHAGPSNSGRTRNHGLHLADGYEDIQPSSSILAPGPGAPRPLTAGPPGQRRLSMSGFNTTDREWRSREVDSPFGQLGPGPRYSLHQGGVEQTLLPYKSGASVDPAGSATTGGWPRGLEKAGAYNKVERPSDNIREEVIDDFLTHDGASDQISFDWNHRFTRTNKTCYGMQPSNLGVRYQHGTGRMTKETIQARADKINSDWYSGANLFSQPGLTLPRETAEKYGFNAPSASMAAGAMPSQYGQLGIKNASRMSVAELGAPLVDVMLAKLACFIAEEQGKSTSRGPSFWPIE